MVFVQCIPTCRQEIRFTFFHKGKHSMFIRLSGEKKGENINYTQVNVVVLLDCRKVGLNRMCHPLLVKLLFDENTNHSDELFM